MQRYYFISKFINNLAKNTLYIRCVFEHVFAKMGVVWFWGRGVFGDVWASWLLYGFGRLL
jgi:hypothetical protein